MRAFKTEGVILKRRDFGEADRILTAFTLAQGKVSIIAKGVRRIHSRRAGNVELLNRVQMFLYPGKQFLNLTEAVSLDTFQKIKEDLTLSTYAYHIIELVDKLTAENQEHRILYSDLVEVLKKLEKSPRQIFIRAFEVKILSLMGFTNFYEDPEDISAEIQSLLQNLDNMNWDEIEGLQINQTQALELERILRYHVERVIEGSLKARQFLHK
jgi:DNA repair protein RecO (recombination protein O)